MKLYCTDCGAEVERAYQLKKVVCSDCAAAKRLLWHYADGRKCRHCNKPVRGPYCSPCYRLRYWFNNMRVRTRKRGTFPEYDGLRWQDYIGTKYPKAQDEEYHKRIIEMFELIDCQNILLKEIADKKMRQKDVAKTYRLAMASSDSPNWTIVNRAIIDRWSMSGLERIKKMAWSGKFK